MIHPRIAARLFNAPLAIHQGKAMAIIAGLGGRVLGNQIEFTGAQLDHRSGTKSAGTVGDRVGRGGKQIYDQVGACAVIPVEGTLVHKGAFVESSSGETSYQGLQAQIMRAARDPAVKGVVFEFDSCGGEVSGMFETAAMIADLSAQKPTLAILSDVAFSAAYALASACRSIVLPEQGACGSIGVITMHVDMSKALEAQGVAVTVIAAGAHKADMNPFAPLPEDVLAAAKADVELYRQAFATLVGKNRGSRFSYDDAMATEAQTYVGAEAVKMGLADATGFPSETFAAFLNELNRA